ncbi:MAG: indole-3-glycerol phosphate synthase TrpC [Bacteroidota bacterium]
MNILQRIASHTREDLQRRRKATSIGALEDRPLFSDERRDFEAALATDDLAIIAEVKRASPSKGVIREDFDPESIAEGYQEAGAAAISVLTEEAHFMGSLEYLERIRRISSLPLLRKDFLIDPYQIVEARAYGADAVLLIAALLEPSQLHELHAAASELGLDALIEIYDQRELDRLDVDRFRIIGVNNRDLKTFEVNLGHSIEVLSALPPDIVRVSESGIESAEDLAHLRARDIDAALVGESFMRAPSPGDRLREVLAELTEMHS